MKRICSLILALSLCISMIPYASDAQVTDYADYTGEFAQGVANAVGVSFANAETVTRIDFVNALVTASGMSGISGSEIPFADVSEGTKGYEAVKTAYELSWISKAPLFNPDSAITLVQALKIGVHAIGGEHQASYWGGYPTGYLRLAQNAELLEDISVGNDDPLSLRDAYVLIYNILTSPTFETGFTSEGDISVSYGGASILSLYHDMYIYEGIVTANTVTNIYNEAESDRNTVVIGGREFNDDVGITDYLGYSVYALYKNIGSKDYICFISPVDTNIVTLSAGDIDHIDGNMVYYGEKGKDKIRVTGSPIYLLNGKTTLKTDPSLSSLFVSDTSSYTFIDNDDDKIYDIISAYHYTYTVVDRYDLYEGIIYDVNSADSFIDLSADGCVCKVRKYENGEYSSAKLSDIETGMVVAAAVSVDGKYADLILCPESVSGSIDETSGDGSVVVDGKEYTVSSYYSLYHTFALGEQAQYLLGIDGEIVAEVSAKSSMNYAFFVDRSQTTGLDKQVMFKLFDQSDRMLTFACADKVTIDGITKNADDAYTLAGSLSTDAERFIRYSLNADGKINCIDTCDDKTTNFEHYGTDVADNNSLSLYFNNKFQPRGSKLFLAPDGAAKFNWAGTEYIFVLPPEADRDDEELYRIASTSEIKTSGSAYKLDLLAFDVDAAGSAKALVVYGGYLQSVSHAEMITHYGVVESVTRAIDKDGEECYKLYIGDISGFSTLYLPMDKANKYGVPSIGDVIGCILEDSYTISYVLVCYDFDTYTIDSNFSDEDADYAIKTGFIYSMSGGYMHYIPEYMKTPYVPVCPQTIDYSQLRNSNVAQKKTVYIDAVRSADGEQVLSVSVNPNPDTKIRTAKTSGKDNASFVVNRMSYGNSQTAYVYTISYK